MNQIEPSHDFLSIYDVAIEALKKEPNSQVLQHRAVLALARAGALDFARAEYKRYGLDKVRHHEDIMALGGRLLKDLALASSGKQRTLYAKQSADLYEAAFRDTKGHYSGINAASMALVAGVPEAIVADRARAILKILPDSETLDNEDLYFAEATRAEAHLILGETNKAATILREAMFHDPLNYTAHASTLKQFRMILRARKEPLEWTRPFTPPKSAHFAGHLFAAVHEAAAGQNALDKKQIKNLRIDISETIQEHDIGFGFGALAAGADILIAETFLAEGAELHVVLPTNKKDFLEFSVAPFGKSWVNKFNQCIAHATSVRTLSESENWPSSQLGSYASQIAMGLAVMRASTLATGMTQLLIWDSQQSHDPMSTASDANIWHETEREQITIPYPGKRAPRENTVSRNGSAKNLMASLVIRQDVRNADAERELRKVLDTCAKQHNAAGVSQQDDLLIISFSSLSDAAECAMEIMETDVKSKAKPNLRIGGYCGFASADDSGDQIHCAERIAVAAPPASVYISENFAAVLAARHENAFKAEYVGGTPVKSGQTPIRMFNLQRQIKN
jgi:hypothetical protein